MHVRSPPQRTPRPRVFPEYTAERGTCIKIKNMLCEGECS